MSGRAQAVLAVVFAALQLACAFATGWYCMAWAYAMMFIYPLAVGGGLTLGLFGLSITFAILSLSKNSRDYLAVFGIILSVLAFGGCYGGCMYKTRVDAHCERWPGDVKCQR
ncbi:MAG: hypothetical protein U0270_31715 [Labilithrix sp.]